MATIRKYQGIILKPFEIQKKKINILKVLKYHDITSFQ